MIITVAVPPQVSKTSEKHEAPSPVESPVQEKMYVEIHGIT